MTSRTCLVLSISGLLAGAAALAGPPSPPAGPIGPTMKPLDQVEPRTPLSQATTPGDADSVFRITAPGSYYLTANLAGESGKAGIEVASGGVAIDLNGFDVAGTGGSLDGIRTSIPNLIHITITNGSVVGWEGDGIDLATEPASSCRVEAVSAAHCGRIGILAGPGSLIARCTARANGTAGAFDMAGISAGRGSTLSDCAAHLNVGHGFVADPGSTVTSCVADGNTRDGIRAGDGSAVTASTVRSNGQCGLRTSFGLSSGQGVTVADCSAQDNAFDGFRIDFRGTITGCSAADNQNGISAGTQCVVRANNCSGNTNAGIHATGGNAVIDSNLCIGNGKGLEVASAGNWIVRNTCAANGLSFSIAAHNRHGPFVVSGGNQAPLNINGPAPGVLNTSDPFANFSN